MFSKYPKLKNILLNAYINPKYTRVRLWARLLVVPFLPKKAKGAVIRRGVRLVISPSRKLQLGRNSSINEYCIINNCVGDIIIGDNTEINNNCNVVGPVSIGNYSRLGTGSKVSALSHNYEDVNISIIKQGYTTKPVVIEDNVWIYPNVCISPGVHIGRHCVIAPGSVVTKSIQPYSMVAGVPAHVIKSYDFELKEWVRV